MLAVTRSKQGRKLTNFSCQAKGAKAVFLAGSFNDWNPHAAPMTKKRFGKWTAELELAPGADEYRFVIDGKWSNEPE